MKACSLNDFMEEMKPWLDSDHIQSVSLDEKGHVVLRFLDGTRNVYHVDDCTRGQIVNVFADLKRRGIKIE